MINTEQQQNSSGNDSRARAILGIVLLIGVVVAASTLPITDWLELASVWIAANPLPGRFLFVAGFVALTVLMVPGSILMLCGGYLFGLTLGIPLVSVSIALGSLASSFVSRTLARDWLARRFAEDVRFQAIDRAVARKGFLIVVLSRLSLLIPYNVLNVIYGLSGIALGKMTVATWLGMLPAVTLYTYLGSIAGDFDNLTANRTDQDWVSQVVLVSGLVMVVIVSIVIHRTATRELKRELDSSEA
ncbi:MAG: TVP38/TMEM64 family protein [Woeseia sp.]